MNRSQTLLQELYPKHVGYLHMLLESGKIHHAYGIAGVSEGPQLAYATLFAEGLLGTDYPLHQHPDFLRIAVAEDRQSIGVDEAHAIRQHLSRRPLVSRYRVVLVEQLDLFTNAAANAVLKILEEPPAFAVIIATTSSMQSLPKTVQSRMQFVHMPQVPQQQVTRVLTDAGITGVSTSQEDMDNTSNMIAGKFERLVAVADGAPEAADMQHEWAFWGKFLAANTAERNTMVQQYLGTGERAQAASHTIAHVLDVLESVLHQSFVRNPAEQQAAYTATATAQLERIQELRTMVAHAVQKKMVFDYLTFAL